MGRKVLNDDQLIELSVLAWMRTFASFVNELSPEGQNKLRECLDTGEGIDLQGALEVIKQEDKMEDFIREYIFNSVKIKRELRELET